MLEFIKQYLSGEKWEELCNSCYRIRYQEMGYQEIPAQYRGDGGIEGFTKNGIVYQCYCPEKEYTDDELYEHMRNKMTTDIAKFISKDYEKVLKGLGINNINQWHFVIPQNKDRRILEHAEKKRKEVLAYREKNLEQCSYIAENFTITIKTAEDFKLEISRIIRNDLGCKLDFTVLRNEKIDWSINQKLFVEILDDFQSVLEKELPYITRSSVAELKDDMISSWLADCSMQFKSR